MGVAWRLVGLATVVVFVGSLMFGSYPYTSEGLENNLVFTHYMLYSFLYTDDVAGFTKEIVLAMSHNIDGFALNTNTWNPEYQARCDNLYTAADNFLGNFKLFFSVDMSGSLTLDNVKLMLTHYSARSSQFTYQGRPFLSTFGGRNPTKPLAPYTDVLSTWRDGVFGGSGIHPFFVPFFETTGQTNDIASCFSQFADILDGLFAWDTSAWPYFNGDYNNPSDIDDRNYIVAAAAAGNKVYMASVSPWFWGTNAVNTIKGNYVGAGLWATHWQQLAELQPPFVEILTWNDWGEHHYVVPVPDTPATTPYGAGDFNDFGYPHQAYLDLAGRYFIPWYKSGQRPIISIDAIYIFYRTHSKSATSSNSDSRPTNYEVLEDKLYVIVLLTTTADVTLTTGSITTTFHGLPSGLQSVSVNFVEGQQSASISRIGVVMRSVTGALPINNTISRYNFNVYSNYAVI